MCRGGLIAQFCVLFIAFVLVYSVPAYSEETSPGFGDETMLFQEIPSVYGASKYEQKVTEAPSSVTIVTSSDIRKFGYRTLADLLKSVRGLFVTYDRNYTYLGARGFNRPGDYNTRILLLVDGHRTNDNIFDQAFLGTDFILDVDLIDRVEIIRGPGSSLYGSNAFFGVINVITKKGQDLQGAEISGEAGSYRTYKGRLSYGRHLSENTDLLVSGSLLDSHGQKSLYFREFDSPDSANGVARDADGDRAGNLFVKLSSGDFVLSGAYISREKTIPTAPYGTAFNVTGTQTADRRGYLDLKYQHSFGDALDLLARLYYDHYSFDGTYLFDQAAPGEPRSLLTNKDESRGNWMGAEVKGSKKISVHTLTLGTEYLKNFSQDQRNFDEDPYYEYLSDRRKPSNWAIYFQDEIAVLRNLIVNAGVRYDHFSTFGGNTSPRAAVIYNPFEKTTLKLLYGEAFRAPNAFEAYYQDGGTTSKANAGLSPEKIKTYEIVIDQYIGERLLLTAAGFYYRINNLITQTLDPEDGLIQYQNIGTAKAKGVELECSAQLGAGVTARASYTYQKTEDDSGRQLSNSPRHLVKMNVVAPLIREKLFTGIEVQHVSRRETLSGEYAKSYTIANLTLFSQKLLPGLSLSGSVYNVFDTEFGDPGFSEHLQDTILQDGRTWRVKAVYAF